MLKLWAASSIVSIRRSCGNSFIHNSATTIAPTPPTNTDVKAPNSAAMVPARNSPSVPEVPVNMKFTAKTRPSISCGVRVCTSEWRMTTLTASPAP